MTPPHLSCARRAAWACALVIAAGAAQAQEHGGPGWPTARSVRTTEPIHVDGRLDEPVWAGAGVLTGFLQREPKQGAVPSEETEVRVLYDSDNLYLGILCRDRSPAAIVSTQLGRDASLAVDDYVLVVLDPFFDHRNGFFFMVNPEGARVDGQISNNAESLTTEWDGIWAAAARTTDEGWVAEIAIPFKTLRFTPGQSVWGLNVERQIKRLQEKDRWASPKQNIWIGNLAEAGHLEGLLDLHQGRGLDIRPFVSAGEDQGDGELKLGLDVFKSLTPSLNAALTVNTDFAETEVDSRQVNLTRFQLFFPEKRAFFLEGAGVFDTAGKNIDVLPFFSRRFGLLEEGTEVPILFGLKVAGRQSDFNIGLLDVQTRSLHDPRVDSQNLLALRVSRNIQEQSWIGVIATRGNPAGTGSNNLVGADLRIATSRFRGDKNLSLDVYAFRSDDETLGKVDYAYGFRLDYPNDRWDVALLGKQIGSEFAPALGFVPRTGIRKLDLFTAFQPRPGKWGIRQFFFELSGEVITNLNGRVDNWEVFTAPLNLRTESGEHLEWNWIPRFERLSEPFEIQPGVVIPPGAYQWTRFRAEANTATKRPWVVDLAYWWGGFYDGSLRSASLSLTLKPNTHVSLVLQGERNDAELPGGNFVTRLWSLRADYNFSPNVTWSNLGQYDSESRLLGFQSRFRWILKPGNDLFLVVNRGWFRREDRDYVPRFDRGSAKLQYTIRL